MKSFENISNQTEPTVVTLTDRHDAHIPFVERHLDKPLIVIDPTSIIEGDELSYKFTDNELSVVYKGQPLENVVGVWYRKPQTLKEEMMPVADSHKEYSLNATRRHTDLLRTQFNDALWVSDYHNIQRAGSKTLQYSIAAKLGFKVPDTLLTSDEAAARHFVNAYPAGTVVKTLANVYPRNEDGTPRMFLTRKTDSTMDYSGLNLAPAVFQEAVDVGAELRVTVVGDKVFPAVVDDDSSETSVRDWRVGHFTGKLKISEFNDLPKDIADKCVAHTKMLGLNYGALDLIIDKKGEVWFLENNPNGQWGFVEEETAQPIGKAVADLLISRKNS